MPSAVTISVNRMNGRIISMAVLANDLTEGDQRSYEDGRTKEAVIIPTSGIDRCFAQPIC